MRFSWRLIVIFFLFMGGFEATRGSAFERFAVETAILAPTVALINAVTPQEHVRLVGRTLRRCRRRDRRGGQPERDRKRGGNEVAERASPRADAHRNPSRERRHHGPA